MIKLHAKILNSAPDLSLTSRYYVKAGRRFDIDDFADFFKLDTNYIYATDVLHAQRLANEMPTNGLKPDQWMEVWAENMGDEGLAKGWKVHAFVNTKTLTAIFQATESDIKISIDTVIELSGTDFPYNLREIDRSPTMAHTALTAEPEFIMRIVGDMALRNEITLFSVTSTIGLIPDLSKLP